jgi:hypothetical protein
LDYDLQGDAFDQFTCSSMDGPKPEVGRRGENKRQTGRRIRGLVGMTVVL